MNEFNVFKGKDLMSGTMWPRHGFFATAFLIKGLNDSIIFF